MAFLVLIAQALLASARWVILGKATGMPTTVLESAVIYLASSVASIILVTSVASVALKAVLHCRMGASVVAVTLSSAFEKVCSLFAVGMTCLTMAFFSENQALVSAVFNRVKSFIEYRIEFGYAASVLAGLIAVGILFVVTSKLILRSRRRIVWMKQKASAIRDLNKKLFAPTILLALGVTSLVIFLLGSISVLIIAQAFSFSVPLANFLFIFPAIAIVAALPISIGGWGVRESAMVLGLGLLNVPPENALAISIAYGLVANLAIIILGSIANGILVNRLQSFV